MTEFDLAVASHMVAPVQTLLHTERLARAAEVMDELGVSALPIVDGNGRLTGVLERSDLLRAGRLQHRSPQGEPRWWWPDVSVSECMQTSVPVSAATQPLRLCAQRMLDRRLNRVYVLAGDDLAGVISTRELMRAVARAGLQTPLRELAAGIAETVSTMAPLSLTSARFLAGAGQPLVVQGVASPAGVFAQPELRACLEADPRLATYLFMDERVLAVPAWLPAQHAAEQAIAVGARYLLAQDPPHGYRVLSGASFAACVAGTGAPSPTQMTGANAEFHVAPSAARERTSSFPGTVGSLPSAERRREEPRREAPPRASEPPTEPGRPRKRE
jgi:CBS domain-containing protein